MVLVIVGHLFLFCLLEMLFFRAFETARIRFIAKMVVVFFNENEANAMLDAEVFEVHFEQLGERRRSQLFKATKLP